MIFQNISRILPGMKKSGLFGCQDTQQFFQGNVNCFEFSSVSPLVYYNEVKSFAFQIQLPVKFGFIQPV